MEEQCRQMSHWKDTAARGSCQHPAPTREDRGRRGGDTTKTVLFFFLYFFLYFLFFFIFLTERPSSTMQPGIRFNPGTQIPRALSSAL